MKKLLTSAAIAATLAGGLALAPAANAANGAMDRSGPPANHHAWIKIPASDFKPNSSIGSSAACNRIFGYGWPGYRPCEHLEPLILVQRGNNWKANGYWAEWYPSTGKTRSGTW